MIRKIRKRFQNLVQEMLQGAYKCQDCEKYGYIQTIPAMTNGIVEDLTEISLESVFCVHCLSKKLTLVFLTKNDAEAQVYYKTIKALENK